MRRTIPLLCGLLLVAGCGGRSVSTVNNNNHVDVPDAAVIPDAEVRPDGGSSTCTEDDSWALAMVPLSGITVLNPALGGNGIPEGVTVRVEATVEFGGCDQMAGVQFYLSPQDQIVTLMGYIWQYQGSADCPAILGSGVERIALRRLPPGDWEIWDYLVNGPGVDFWIRPCSAAEDCLCDSWQGIPGDWGTACDFDCQCQPHLGCVMDGSGGCYQTCSVTSDCRPPLFCNDFLPQTSQGVCLSTGLIDSCQSDADCAQGFACLPVQGQGFDWCQPAMDPDGIGVPCAADCDCDPGLSCVARPNEEAPTCQIKCRGNGDCPSGTVCDDPGSAEGFNLLTCR